MFQITVALMSNFFSPTVSVAAIADVIKFLSAANDTNNSDYQIAVRWATGLSFVVVIKHLANSSEPEAELVLVTVSV